MKSLLVLSQEDSSCIYLRLEAPDVTAEWYSLTALAKLTSVESIVDLKPPLFVKVD